MEENKEHPVINQPLPPLEKHKSRCKICGSIVWGTNFKRHLRSEKHKNAFYVLKEQFEIE